MRASSLMSSLRRCGRRAPTLAMNSSISCCWVASSSERSTTRSAAAPASRAISARSSSPARPAAGGDVGVGLGLELGDLGVEPGPAVGEQRLGLGVGLGEQALAARPRCRRAPGGSAPPRPRRRALAGGRVVELALDPVGAGGHRLLDERPGLPDQQADDDHRGEAAVDDLGLLGPQRVMGGVALVVDAVLGLRQAMPATSTVVRRRSSADPRAHHVADRLGDGVVVGSPAGRQLAGRGGDVADGRLDRRPGPPAGPPRPRRPPRPAARRSRR